MDGSTLGTFGTSQLGVGLGGQSLIAPFAPKIPKPTGVDAEKRTAPQAPQASPPPTQPTPPAQPQSPVQPQQQTPAAIPQQPLQIGDDNARFYADPVNLLFASFPQKALLQDLLAKAIIHEQRTK